MGSYVHENALTLGHCMEYTRGTLNMWYNLARFNSPYLVVRWLWTHVKSQQWEGSFI